MDYLTTGGDENPKERLIEELHARANVSAPSPPRFPEIRGVCRTCEHAHIMRREYEEMPEIYCSAMNDYQRSARMPLDVMECTEYRQRGQPSLREMAELAIIIDPRKKGGQYL